MLCSEQELKMSDNSKGIIELNKNYEVGHLFSEYIKEDYIYEIGLTPNRGDCASIRGIARDLAGKLNKKNTFNKVEHKKGTYQSSIKWETLGLKKREDCPHILGRHFTIEHNNESPNWLKNKLLSIGLNPISSLVDITNYILFDIGRPLHVFDAQKISGSLKVRRAKSDENFVGLDNKNYKLSEEDLIIADDEKVVSLAGIMGGINSCVDHNTKEVFLESAYFDPLLIAKTGRRLNIMSDSRYRFERGIDPEGLYEGLDSATKLIHNICGGNFSFSEEKGQPIYIKKEIEFNSINFDKIVGYKINKERQIEILKNLCFSVVNQESEKIKIMPPSWRHDINTENDIIEEISRIEGYEKIPYTKIFDKRERKDISFSKLNSLRIDYRERLANIGLNELITFTFISPNKIIPKMQLKEQLTLSNPISKEQSVMRNSLYPNLLDATANNFSRGIESVNFFEIGSVFDSNKFEGQKTFLALVKCGFSGHKTWTKKRRNFDFFDIKSDILELLDYLNLNKKIKFKRSNSEWYHPGKSAEIIFNEIKLGSFGELHPSLYKVFNLKNVAFIGQLELNKLEKYYTTENQKQPYLPSNFLSLKKDFSFVINKNSSVGDLIEAVKKSSSLIEEVSVFDVYEIKSKMNDNISVALEVEIVQREKVFNSEEINKLMTIIIENARKLGAKLRD